MAQGSQRGEETIARLAGEPAWTGFLKADVALLIWSREGRLLWRSPTAAPLQVAIIEDDGTIDPASPGRRRVEALAGGLAPRQGARLERIRFDPYRLAAPVTLACRLLATADGEVLVTAVVGALPKLSPRPRRQGLANGHPTQADGTARSSLSPEDRTLSGEVAPASIPPEGAVPAEQRAAEGATSAPPPADTTKDRGDGEEAVSADNSESADASEALAESDPTDEPAAEVAEPAERIGESPLPASIDVEAPPGKEPSPAASAAEARSEEELSSPANTAEPPPEEEPSSPVSTAEAPPEEKPSTAVSAATGEVTATPSPNLDAETLASTTEATDAPMGAETSAEAADTPAEASIESAAASERAEAVAETSTVDASTPSEAPAAGTEPPPDGAGEAVREEATIESSSGREVEEVGQESSAGALPAEEAGIAEQDSVEPSQDQKAATAGQDSASESPPKAAEQNTSGASEPDQEPAVETGPPDPKAALRARGRLRFLWQSDPEGRFTAVSDSLAEVVGAHADIVGRRWTEIAAAFVEDPAGVVAELFARGETWSSRTVHWHVAGIDAVVPVDLAGVPALGPGRRVLGYRGFGVIRAEDIADLPHRRTSEALPEQAVADAPADELPQPEEASSDTSGAHETAEDTTSKTRPPSAEPAPSSDAGPSSDPERGPGVAAVETEPPSGAQPDSGKAGSVPSLDVARPEMDGQTITTEAPAEPAAAEAREETEALSGEAASRVLEPPSSETRDPASAGDWSEPVEKPDDGDIAAEDRTGEHGTTPFDGTGSPGGFDTAQEVAADLLKADDTDTPTASDETTKTFEPVDDVSPLARSTEESDSGEATETRTRPDDRGGDGSAVSPVLTGGPDPDDFAADPGNGRAKAETAEVDADDSVPAQEAVAVSEAGEDVASLDAEPEVEEGEPSAPAATEEDEPHASGAVTQTGEGEAAASQDVAAVPQGDLIDLPHAPAEDGEAVLLRDGRDAAIESASSAADRQVDLLRDGGDAAIEGASSAADRQADRRRPRPSTDWNPPDEGERPPRRREDPLSPQGPAASPIGSPGDGFHMLRGQVHARLGTPAPVPLRTSDPVEEGALRIDLPDYSDDAELASGEIADAPRLSTTERSAFREIARALGARFAGDDEEAEAPKAAPSPTVLPMRRPSSPEGDAQRLLDRLPVGVLIHRGEEPLYVNRLLLDLIGYDDVAELDRDGGVARLFRGRPPAAARSEEGGAPLALSTRRQGSVPVDVRLTTVEWSGLPASLMLIRRVPEGDANQRINALELDLRARENKVRELSAILDTATDGVVLLDDAGRILSLNRSAEALFGYDQKEVTGESVTVLFSPESHLTALDYFDGLRSNGVASLLNDGREVLGRVRQGGAIPLFMTMGRVSDGSERKFCAVLRDITAFKKAESELTAAKRAAERASAHKSDFLAKVSHEIRTPLNAIIGFAEVMLEERFGAVGNERYRDYLKDIHESGGHVISLVNDLLDLAKIEAGRMELAFASINLNELVSSCVSLLQPQASRDRIVMRTSFANRLPPVVADERSVRQIALNLISNAIKFTDAGGQVIVSTAMTDRGEVALRVRDTGIGMTEEEIEAALEPFRQLATARKGGGTGLGLPLTKALVEANRAALHISSEPNAGTLVEVLFPPTRVLAE